MNEEEKITISVNEEDVQNIINAYEKDIEYINQLEKENKELKRKLNEAIHKATEFESEVYELQQENQKYKEVIDKEIKLLGNYKHYSIPDEKQNSDNEDLVNNAFDILKGVNND